MDKAAAGLRGGRDPPGTCPCPCPPAGQRGSPSQRKTSTPQKTNQKVLIKKKKSPREAGEHISLPAVRGGRARPRREDGGGPAARGEAEGPHHSSAWGMAGAHLPTQHGQECLSAQLLLLVATGQRSPTASTQVPGQASQPGPSAGCGHSGTRPRWQTGRPRVPPPSSPLAGGCGGVGQVSGTAWRSGRLPRGHRWPGTAEGRGQPQRAAGQRAASLGRGGQQDRRDRQG